jgi:hypothetical protein
MWKEMWLPRAPENNRTGIEIKPKVKYPDHTEDAIFRPFAEGDSARSAQQKHKLGFSPVENWAEYDPALRRRSSSLILQRPANLRSAAVHLGGMHPWAGCAVSSLPLKPP